MSHQWLEGHTEIIQALPEAIVLVTEEGLICATNPPFRRVLGLSMDALLGRQLKDLVTDPPEKLSAYLQNCARSHQPVLGTLTLAISLEDTLPFRCEGSVVRPWSTNTPAVVLLRLRPRESVINRFVLLNRTIEELNQEVRERRQVEARLRVLAEVSLVLAASLDYRTILQQVAELVVKYCADWCMIFLHSDAGIERVATAHTNPSKVEFAYVLTQRFPHYTVPAPFVHVIESGQSLFLPQYNEATMLRGITDAEHIDLIRRIGPKSVVAVPLQARGQTSGVLVLVWSESEQRYNESDLSFAEELARRTALLVDNVRLYQEARMAEAQLREFNYSLENLVAERTYELQRSNHELDQFAYVASHDLKAPLRAISHLSEWLVEDAGNALPAVALGHLTKLRQRVARMERLLDDLLAYARAGRESHAAESVNCVSLIENVVELLAPPPEFVITIDDSLPILHTERVPLETVFRNLLNNAIKHHDHLTTGQVWVTAQSLGDTIEFAVADNGPGIDTQYHERIFEIFKVLKPRDQTEGSGIGLAVVKKIVEHHGGTMRLESQVGRGSTFYFTWLPSL